MFSCVLPLCVCVCVCVGWGVLVLVCQTCHFSSRFALWPSSTPEYSCQYVTGIFQVPKLAALKAASHAKGVRNVFELPIPELYRMEPCLNRHAQGALWIPGETVLEPNVYGVLLAHHAKKNGSKVGQLPVNSVFFGFYVALRPRRRDDLLGTGTEWEGDRVIGSTAETARKRPERP